jgi:exodeoxyribonuclease VII small subunit
MSKAAKAASQPASEEPSFEQALSRIESIVESMESEELPLETLLARYEEGSRLAKACQTRLAAAELKIQQLEKNSQGDLTVRPAALDASAE